MTQTSPTDVSLEDVLHHARNVAAGDGLFRRRADVSPDDVAQDVAMQFHRLAAPPENWRAWTARATRNRVIDLARQRSPIAVLQSELTERAERAMGPSAGVVAGRQVAEAIAVLTSRERTIFAEHLLGGSNADIAERHGYASAAVVATLIHRISRKVRDASPGLKFDVEPQRMY